MIAANGDSIESEPSIHTDHSSSTVYTSSIVYNSAVQRLEPCRPFKYHEILAATKNFDDSLVIGAGGFGKVYKGNLVTGSTSVSVAIKRLNSMSKQGASEFRAEVEAISKVRHTHVVPLIGYCDYENEKILVYAYIPNGTLEDHLHKFRTALSWLLRLKICIGVARGLDSLHTGTSNDSKFGIIHGDVKPSNILLNRGWVAMISDFGMSKMIEMDRQSIGYVNTNVRGTVGYMAPDYFYTARLSKKSDIYAFGVVLVEVLCRRRAIDKHYITQGHLKHIIDSEIRDSISQKSLKGFIQVVVRCLDDNPQHRPTMTEVVSSLEFVLNLQEKHEMVLQDAARKTVPDRQGNSFSVTTNDKNSGRDYGFRMPKKWKLLMLRNKILRQNDILSVTSYWKNILQLKAKCFGSIKIFQSKDLEKATNNYANDRILGRGAQGIVYKGILPDKRVVAVKTCMILGQSQLEQCITEILILEKIKHRNVVQLLGCCFNTEGALLVYEFVSNGTLHHLIHNETSGTCILSWDSRLRIAHESAEALAYLHAYETVSIIHRDVKSANILLDENHNPKVSDFGSALLIPLNHGEVATRIEGTTGYLDPEYMHTYKATPKIDVYAFGVVLAELLTGKKPIDRKRDEDDIGLSTYFVKETNENRLREIVDPQVLEEAADEQLRAACDLVYRCLELFGDNRPTMKEVTMELETIRNKHPSVSQDN